MKRPSRTRRGGFSLIEVLFGVFLSAVCATLIATSMPVADRSRNKADLNNKATSMAQKQLEKVRGLGYANATPAQLFSFGLIDSTTPVQGSSNTYSFNNVDYSSRDNVGKILPSGTGAIRIEQVDLDLRRVTVEIDYVDAGRAKSVSVGTLIANL